MYEFAYWALVIGGFAAAVYKGASTPVAGALVRRSRTSDHQHSGATLVRNVPLRSTIMSQKQALPETVISALKPLHTELKIQTSMFDVSNFTENDLRELLRLADRDPQAALDQVARMSASDRRIPGVRLVRVVAIGNLLWRPLDDGQVNSRTYADVREYFEGLPASKAKLAEEAVHEVKEIEIQLERNFFVRTETENLVNRVCVPADVRNPGVSQRILGWTKVFLFKFNRRYYELDENDPDTEDLKDLPSDIKSKFQVTRFSCNRQVASVCLVGARRASNYWVGFYLLGARSGQDGSKVSDMSPFAVYAVRSDGETHIEYRKDSPSASVSVHVPAGFASTSHVETLERVERLLTEIRSELRSGRHTE